MIDNAAPIVMAEDDEEDQLLVKLALQKAKMPNPFHYVEDGQALLDFLYQKGSYADALPPALVILDLNMPGKDGMTALKEIRNDSRFDNLPIIILSTSSERDDIVAGYRFGANSYIIKPSDFDKLVEIVNNLGEYWFSIVEAPNEKE